MSTTQKILEADTGDSSLIANLARHAKQCEAQLAQWAEAADASQQPQAFYDGYSEAQMRAMQAMLTKAKKEAADAKAACEDWIKIANNGASDTARIDWLSRQARVDYSKSYWLASSGWPFREALDNSIRLWAGAISAPQPPSGGNQ